MLQAGVGDPGEGRVVRRQCADRCARRCRHAATLRLDAHQGFWPVSSATFIDNATLVYVHVHFHVHVGVHVGVHVHVHMHLHVHVPMYVHVSYAC